MFVVHIQFRRDAHSFSLSELPLVVGFFFAPPLTVVLSMVAGTALALTIHRRQSPLKLAFNLANFTVANSVAAVLFMHLVNHHDPLSMFSFLGVLVAILAGGILQSLVILMAISFSEGRIDRAGIAVDLRLHAGGHARQHVPRADRCPHRLAEPRRAVVARHARPSVSSSRIASTSPSARSATRLTSSTSRASSCNAPRLSMTPSPHC